jgi:hypothetical protein
MIHLRHRPRPVAASLAIPHHHVIHELLHYKPEDPLPSVYYGPDPYDINWMMPLHEATLESDRVKLTPFIPSLYARPYADQVKAHPDLHRWYSFEYTFAHPAPT